MIGLLVAAVGVVLVLVGLVAAVGVWSLVPAGGVLVLVGVFVDFDRVKESERG